MLSKNPDAAFANPDDACADLHSEALDREFQREVEGEAAPFRRSLKELAHYVSAEMTALAKVPKPEAISLWYSFIEESLGSWIRGSVNDERSRVDLLNETKCAAVALREQLEKLHQHIEETHKIYFSNIRSFRDDPLSDPIRPGDGSVVLHLMPNAIARIGQWISVLIEGIDRANRKPRRGKYPGLAQLVQDFEFLALFAGGKGFGLPTKYPAKGRIIQMLDRLRNYLKTNPEWESLAQFIPPPDRHPVSIYQRAVNRARAGFNRARAELTRENLRADR
jgi:hypothetical protein